MSLTFLLERAALAQRPDEICKLLLSSAFSPPSASSSSAEEEEEEAFAVPYPLHALADITFPPQTHVATVTKHPHHRRAEGADDDDEDKHGNGWGDEDDDYDCDEVRYRETICEAGRLIINALASSSISSPPLAAAAAAQATATHTFQGSEEDDDYVHGDADDEDYDDDTSNDNNALYKDNKEKKNTSTISPLWSQRRVRECAAKQAKDAVLKAMRTLCDTPIHRAIRNGHMGLAKLFLEAVMNRERPFYCRRQRHNEKKRLLVVGGESADSTKSDFTSTATDQHHHHCCGQYVSDKALAQRFFEEGLAEARQVSAVHDAIARAVQVGEPFDKLWIPTVPLGPYGSLLNAAACNGSADAVRTVHTFYTTGAFTTISSNNTEANENKGEEEDAKKKKRGRGGHGGENDEEEGAATATSEKGHIAVSSSSSSSFSPHYPENFSGRILFTPLCFAASLHHHEAVKAILDLNICTANIASDEAKTRPLFRALEQFYDANNIAGILPHQPASPRNALQEFYHESVAYNNIDDGDAEEQAQDYNCDDHDGNEDNRCANEAEKKKKKRRKDFVRTVQILSDRGADWFTRLQRSACKLFGPTQQQRFFTCWTTPLNIAAEMYTAATVKSDDDDADDQQKQQSATTTTTFSKRVRWEMRQPFKIFLRSKQWLDCTSPQAPQQQQQRLLFTASRRRAVQCALRYSNTSTLKLLIDTFNNFDVNTPLLSPLPTDFALTEEEEQDDNHDAGEEEVDAGGESNDVLLRQASPAADCYSLTLLHEAVDKSGFIGTSVDQQVALLLQLGADTERQRAAPAPKVQTKKKNKAPPFNKMTPLSDALQSYAAAVEAAATCKKRADKAAAAINNNNNHRTLNAQQMYQAAAAIERGLFNAVQLLLDHGAETEGLEDEIKLLFSAT